MTKETCLNKIFSVYKETEKQIANIETEVEGQVNVDMDINIKAQAYQKVKEIFDNLIREKNNKNGGEKDGKKD